MWRGGEWLPFEVPHFVHLRIIFPRAYISIWGSLKSLWAYLHFCCEYGCCLSLGSVDHRLASLHIPKIPCRLFHIYMNSQNLYPAMNELGGASMYLIGACNSSMAIGFLPVTCQNGGHDAVGRLMPSKTLLSRHLQSG